MIIAKIVIFVFSGILMIYALSKLNYKNLSSKENVGYYFNIISAICVMLAISLSLLSSLL